MDAAPVFRRGILNNYMLIKTRRPTDAVYIKI